MFTFRLRTKHPCSLSCFTESHCILLTSAAQPACVVLCRSWTQGGNPLCLQAVADVGDAKWHFAKRVNLKRKKSLGSEEERPKVEEKENEVDEDMDKEGIMFFFCSLLRHRVQIVTRHASEIVLHCCNINLLVLLQRQEENSGVDTHRFVTAHFVRLLLCHGHWRNYAQRADMAASTQTHNHTEIGPSALLPSQKQLQHENSSYGGGEKGDSLSVSPFRCFSCFSSPYPATFI